MVRRPFLAVMRAAAISLGTVSISCAQAQDPVSGPAAAPTFTLTADNIASILPPRNTSESEFSRRWGEFEIRVPKGRFPLPAPHCRSTVILRMPARVPGRRSSAERLRLRWELFQSIWQIVADRHGELTLTLAQEPYTRRGLDGKYTLEYCNAYIEPAADAAAVRHNGDLAHPPSAGPDD